MWIQQFRAEHWEQISSAYNNWEWGQCVCRHLQAVPSVLDLQSFGPVACHVVGAVLHDVEVAFLELLSAPLATEAWKSQPQLSPIPLQNTHIPDASICPAPSACLLAADVHSLRRHSVVGPERRGSWCSRGASRRAAKRSELVSLSPKCQKIPRPHLIVVIQHHLAVGVGAAEVITVPKLSGN